MVRIAINLLLPSDWWRNFSSFYCVSCETIPLCTQRSRNWRFLLWDYLRPISAVWTSTSRSLLPLIPFRPNRQPQLPHYHYYTHELVVVVVVFPLIIFSSFPLRLSNRIYVTSVTWLITFKVCGIPYVAGKELIPFPHLHDPFTLSCATHYTTKLVNIGTNLIINRCICILKDLHLSFVSFPNPV